MPCDIDFYYYDGKNDRIVVTGQKMATKFLIYFMT